MRAWVPVWVSFLILLPLMGTSLGADASATHALRIVQLETPKHYTGVAYVEIICLENGTVIYRGYVINRTIVIQKAPYNAVFDNQNNTCIIEFWDSDRKMMITMKIPIEADFVIGKTETDDGGAVVEAVWNLPGGRYRVMGKAFTAEDLDKYQELNIEYPDFVCNRDVDLMDNMSISMFFKPEENLPPWTDLYIFLKHLWEEFWILYTVITIACFLCGYLMVRRYYRVDMGRRWLAGIYAVFSIPALILLVYVHDIIFFNYDDVALGYFLFYAAIYTVIILVSFWIMKNMPGVRWPPPVRESKITDMYERISMIYGAILFYSAALLIYLIRTPSMCYAPPSWSSSPWRPEVAKNLLVFPILLMRRRKLKRRLMESGIYREEWDEA